MMARRFLLILFGILCCCGSVTFAEETDRTLDKNQPIEITAQHLEILEQQRQSIFTGDVVAIQGDMTLSADRLIISLQESQDQIDGWKRLATYGSFNWIGLLLQIGQCSSNRKRC